MNTWFGRVGTENALPEKMPSVWLVTDMSCPEEYARFVAAGCEEEGIPLSWHVQPGNSHELSYFASTRAQLQVGIGLDGNGIGAVSIVSLPGQPYVSEEARTEESLRWLGQVAAKLSKGQPLPLKKQESKNKVLSFDNETSPISVSDQIDDIETLVKMAIASLNK
jgi:hypothetical protein